MEFGRADYARLVAGELGIEECFSGFLPKPHVMIDDQEVAAWRRLIQVYPGQCEGLTVSSYRRAISGEKLFPDTPVEGSGDDPTKSAE